MLLIAQLVIIILGDRVTADEHIIMLVAGITREGILADHQPAPDRVRLPVVLLLLRAVLPEIGISVRQMKGPHPLLLAQSYLQCDIVGEGKSLHPQCKIRLRLFVQPAEASPGHQPLIVIQPVLRRLLKGKAVTSRKHRTQKHPLMIAHDAVHERIFLVELLHHQKRLNRLFSPVRVIAEQVQLVTPVVAEADLLKQPVKLIQRAVNITDYISCHSRDSYELSAA